MNMYAYVGNDPINGKDPIGQAKVPNCGTRIARQDGGRQIQNCTGFATQRKNEESEFKVTFTVDRTVEYTSAAEAAQALLDDDEAINNLDHNEKDEFIGYIVKGSDGKFYKTDVALIPANSKAHVTIKGGGNAQGIYAAHYHGLSALATFSISDGEGVRDSGILGNFLRNRFDELYLLEPNTRSLRDLLNLNTNPDPKSARRFGSPACPFTEKGTGTCF